MQLHVARTVFMIQGGYLLKPLLVCREFQTMKISLLPGIQTPGDQIPDSPLQSTRVSSWVHPAPFAVFRVPCWVCSVHPGCAPGPFLDPDERSYRGKSYLRRDFLSGLPIKFQASQMEESRCSSVDCRVVGKQSAHVVKLKDSSNTRLPSSAKQWCTHTTRTSSALHASAGSAILQL